MAIQTQAIGDLAELSDGDVQDSVRVAAITRRVELAERRFLFVRNFSVLRHEADSRVLLDGFLRVLTRHAGAVPTPVADDFWAVVRTYEPRTPLEEAA